MAKKDKSGRLDPKLNKFHVGNEGNGKHYWITPPEIYDALNAVINSLLILNS